MATIASFLLSIAGSLTARVLLSLGIGFLSYAAITTLAANVISEAQANYNSVDPVILQLLNLGGAGQFLGIIAAGLMARASLLAVKKLSVLAS